MHAVAAEAGRVAGPNRLLVDNAGDCPRKRGHSRPMKSNIVGAWPFLRQEGIKAGLTKHHLDGPAYLQLFGSVRVTTRSQLTPEVVARAAVLVVPDGVISHQSAARLHGGVVPEDTSAHVTVARARQRRCREGLVVHVGQNRDTVELGPIRLTSPARTFCDLADHLSLVDLVVLGDSMVHRGSLELDALRDAVDEMVIGARTLARRGAEMVRAGVESPMESRVRLMMVLAGLPEPVVNQSIGGVDGRVRYRLDLSYPELRFAIEYDGRQHAEDAAQWGHDIKRREWLNDHGWRLLVLRAADVYDTPWQAVRRIGSTLASRGYDKPLSLQPPAEFRVHFPGRPWRVGQGS